VVEQVFQNLISNALLHAATASEPFLNIHEATDATGTRRWVIEDNGPGIPPNAWHPSGRPILKTRNLRICRHLSPYHSYCQ